MRAYYLYDGTNEVGPFTIKILKKQKLTRSTLIRQDGTDTWVPAEKLEGLKEIVAPQKIKRAKDIIPMLMESTAAFKQQRPKTLYAILFCMALLAGFSIYSIDKEERKELPQGSAVALPTSMATVQQLMPIISSALPAGITEKKEAVTVAVKEIPKEDNEKAARHRWNKLFTATNSNYGIGLLGGIKDLSVIVTNKSDYPVDEAVAKVTYIKANGEVWKSQLVTIYNVLAGDSKQQPVPDVGRGKKVTITLQKIISKKMKFSYMAGKKTGNAEDPYVIL